jgi:hypothetical protein
VPSDSFCWSCIHKKGTPFRVNLAEILDAHKKAAFPSSCLGKRVGDNSLESLNLAMEAVVTFYVQAGELEPILNQLLHTCHTGLDEVLRHLRGDEQVYFDRLRLMASCIITEIHKADHPHIDLSAVMETRHRAFLYGGQLDGSAIELDKPYPEIILPMPIKDDAGNVTGQRQLFYRNASKGPPWQYQFVKAEVSDGPVA